MRGWITMLLAAAVAGGLACETGDPCETRGDMLESPEGLVLTVEEHPAGWGQERCSFCHPSWSYHQANCTAVEELDMLLLMEMADVEDPESCFECHGTNGVEP